MQISVCWEIVVPEECVSAESEAQANATKEEKSEMAALPSGSLALFSRYGPHCSSGHIYLQQVHHLQRRQNSLTI